MKVTKWIAFPYNNELNSSVLPDGLIDPDDERMKLVNKNKHLFIRDDEAQKYASENSCTFEEAKKKLEEMYDTIPTFTDEKKADELLKISEKCDKAVHKFCVENKIFYTDEEHQSSGFACCPVIDDKYVVTYSLRAWSDLMAGVWNEILDRDDLMYLDIYCNSVPASVEKYLKDNNIWGEEPPLADD